MFEVDTSGSTEKVKILIGGATDGGSTSLTITYVGELYSSGPNVYVLKKVEKNDASPNGGNYEITYIPGTGPNAAVQKKPTFKIIKLYGVGGNSTTNPDFDQALKDAGGEGDLNTGMTFTKRN